MKSNGLQPKKASCIKNGYWIQAAEAAFNISNKHAKAVSNYWHANVNNFRFLIGDEIVSNIIV